MGGCALLKIWVGYRLDWGLVSLYKGCRSLFEGQGEGDEVEILCCLLKIWWYSLNSPHAFALT